MEFLSQYIDTFVSIIVLDSIFLNAFLASKMKLYRLNKTQSNSTTGTVNTTFLLNFIYGRPSLIKLIMSRLDKDNTRMFRSRLKLSYFQSFTSTRN